MGLSATQTASIVILAAIVLLIVGAVLVGRTAPSRDSRDISDPNKAGNRIAGIVLLVLGCAGVAICSIIIGVGANTEIRRRFVNEYNAAEDPYNYRGNAKEGEDGTVGF